MVKRVTKSFGAKKDKRGSNKIGKKAKLKRQEKKAEMTYERNASDDDNEDNDDMMKFGKQSIITHL